MILIRKEESHGWMECVFRSSSAKIGRIPFVQFIISSHCEVKPINVLLSEDVCFELILIHVLFDCREAIPIQLKF